MSNNGKLLNESYEESVRQLKMYDFSDQEKKEQKIAILREYAKAALTGAMAGRIDSAYSSYVKPEAYSAFAWQLADLMYEEEQKRR